MPDIPKKLPPQSLPTQNSTTPSPTFHQVVPFQGSQNTFSDKRPISMINGSENNLFTSASHKTRRVADVMLEPSTKTSPKDDKTLENNKKSNHQHSSSTASPSSARLPQESQQTNHEQGIIRGNRQMLAKQNNRERTIQLKWYARNENDLLTPQTRKDICDFNQMRAEIAKREKLLHNERLLTALQTRIRVLKRIRKSNRDLKDHNKHISIDILTEESSMYRHLPEDLKRDKEIALAAVKKNSNVFEHLPDEFKEMPEFLSLVEQSVSHVK